MLKSFVFQYFENNHLSQTWNLFAIAGDNSSNGDFSSSVRIYDVFSQGSVEKCDVFHMGDLYEYPCTFVLDNLVIAEPLLEFTVSKDEYGPITK